MAMNPGQLISPFLRCMHCCHVLRQPVQAHCGHRFCLNCFENVIFFRNPHPKCSGCLEDGNIFDCVLKDDKAYIDRAAVRELSNTHIICDNSPQCRWQGSYNGYQRHADFCPFEKVPCINEGCEEKMNRNDLDNHLQNHCGMRGEEKPLRRAIYATDYGGKSNRWQVHVFPDRKISPNDKKDQIPETILRNRQAIRRTSW